MKKTALLISALVASFCCGFFFRTIFAKQPTNYYDIKQTGHIIKIKNGNNLKLGAFSVSLSVKDLTVSKHFYENLGFTVFAGGMEKNYLIMKNKFLAINAFSYVLALVKLHPQHQKHNAYYPLNAHHKLSFHQAS